MNKTSLFTSVLALLTLLGLVSCNSENEVINPGKEIAKTSFVSFSITIPMGDPVTYNPIHDEAEYGIESLWLYEFKEDEGSTAPNLADRFKLISKVDIKSALNGTGPEYTYEKAIAEADHGIRRFVFVANEEPLGIDVGSTLSQLQEKLASKTLAAGNSPSVLLNTFGIGSEQKQCIPMTGEGRHGEGVGSENITITGTPSPVTVKMTRIVARIDISNNVPGLDITEAKLMNTNSTSYLFNKADYTIPVISSKVGNISTFAQLPSPFGKGVNLAKAFYLYEGAQPGDKANALRVEIKGTYSGTPVFYSIPFWKESEHTGVLVKRNHIYRLVLGEDIEDQEGSKISFTIEDNPWNEQLMNELFAPMVATYTSNVGTYKAKERLLTLDNAAHGALTFKVDNKFSSHSDYAVAVSSEGSGWLTANVVTVKDSEGKLTLTTTANTTNAVRKATVTLTSNGSTKTKYIINVEQAQ